MHVGQPAWHTMSMYLKVEMLIFSYAPELELFMCFSKTLLSVVKVPCQIR